MNLVYALRHALDCIKASIEYRQGNPAFEYSTALLTKALASGLDPIDEARPVYIHKDHLQQARQAPFLCRVTPEPGPDRLRIVVADGLQPSQASSRDVLYDEIDPNMHDEIPRALGWREAITPTRLTSLGGAPAACEAAAASFRPVPRLWKARTQGEDASRCGVAASSSHAQCAQCGAPDRPARLLEHPWLNELSAPERPCGVKASGGKTEAPTDAQAEQFARVVEGPRA